MGLIYMQCVLGNFQYGSFQNMWPECSHFFFEVIWNNYIYMQHKNKQVGFIIFLHVRRCNSLRILKSLNYDVGVEICLIMIWSTRSADWGQIVHLLFFWWSTITNYWKHSPKTSREFIIPVGYFSLKGTSSKCKQLFSIF